jgi:sialate O-acetylesterase
LAVLATASPATEFKPARIFSSQMILQREHPVPVWGSGPDGATVEVDFAGQKKTAQVADGRWEVVLDPMPVSAQGRSMTLTTGERKITLEHILVGDVWLASGQSNMQMALGGTVGGKEAISASADPLLRFFITPMKLGPESPSIPAEWDISAPSKTGRLTAVGYHFARELRQATGIPIGIVQCAYGGSRAESWSSPELMSRSWPGYENFVKNQKPEHFEKYPQVVASACYESMLRPLIPFAFRGTIWYQGEGNSGTPDEHKTLLPALIGEFRKQFRRNDMPFYFVQLALLEKADWSAMRRAQLHIWEKTPDTFMAVTLDLPKTYNENDHPIHPNVKQPIGERLARAARHFIYGEPDLLPSGPRFKDAVHSEGKTVLTFDYAGAGLSTLDGQSLRGLYAGPLGGPLKAVDATMQNEKLVIDHAANGLSLPILIRYGSEEDMGKETLDVNLSNSEKLPASPFMVSQAGNSNYASANGVVQTHPVTASLLEAWKTTYFAANASNASISALSADPDADGYTNAYEFAFGGNPAVSDSISTTSAISNGNFTFSFKKRKNPSDATYEVRMLSDLLLDFASGNLLSTQPSSPQPTGIEAEYKQVEAVMPISAKKGFIRVKATLP